MTNKHNGLTLAFWLNLLFSVVELIGGLLTNSTAIMTDALHDFGDAMSIGLAVWLERWSDKPATDSYTFGYRRFSLLSAFLMSSVLLVGAVIMIVSALETLLKPQIIHSQGMIGLAILGVLVNGLAVFRIKEDSHHHAHNHFHHQLHSSLHGSLHSHGNSLDRSQTNKQNQNSKAIMLHLMEDLLGWLAVLVGAVVMYFTDWYWVDGVLAILIALFIGFNAVINLKESLSIFLMATPKGIDVAQLRTDILALDSVQLLDKLRVWSLDGVKSVASVKVVCQKNASSAEAVSEITQILNDYHITDVTVEVDGSIDSF